MPQQTRIRDEISILYTTSHRARTYRWEVGSSSPASDHAICAFHSSSDAADDDDEPDDGAALTPLPITVTIRESPDTQDIIDRQQGGDART